MSDMDHLLTEPFRRLIADICPASVVRAEEARVGVASFWSELEGSGFLDALVPTKSGGAGLTLGNIFPLIAICGEYAVTAPIAETMIAYGLLKARGVEPPIGAAIVLAPASPVTPLAAKASHALVSRSDSLVLVAIEGGEPDPFNAGGLAGVIGGSSVLEVPAQGVDLLSCAAAVAAARMAGAMAHILNMAVTYVNERSQFGRPLGKFQAIQQQLAMAAEEAVAAYTAAQIGLSGSHFDRLRTAVAKARTGKAARSLCSIIHGVHGAIGVTEEYELQIYTRRLKQDQIAFGSTGFWSGVLGDARLKVGQGSSADFVRHKLQEAN